MECNKDEAIRVMEIAERKMKNSDFAGAKKFALKSRQLYASLDNISMILAICEVHCSDLNKMFGSQVDWYDVLQIEKMADGATIKRQYRKLALLLHPDKNKFAGAEAAFKLIGEANRVLSNRTTRSVFDLKIKDFMKTPIMKSKSPSHPPCGGSTVNKHQKAQHTVNNSANQPFMATAPQKNSQTSQPGTDKIWASCPRCRTRIEYFKSVLGGQISCQTCRSTFTAYETGPPIDRSNTSSNRPECLSSKGNSGSAEYNGGSDKHSVGDSMPALPTKAGFPVSNSKQKVNDIGGVKLDAKKSCTKFDSGKLVLGLMANASNSKNKKRGRPEVEDSNRTSAGLGDVATVADHDKNSSKREGKCDARELCQRKRNASYAESLYDEGEIAISPKMPDTLHSNIKGKNEAVIHKGL